MLNKTSAHFHYSKLIFFLALLFFNNISNAQNITESEMLKGVWSPWCAQGGQAVFFIKDNNNNILMLTTIEKGGYWLPSFKDRVIKSYTKDGIFFIQTEDNDDNVIRTIKYDNNTWQTTEVLGKNGPENISYLSQKIKLFCDPSSLSYKNTIKERAQLINYYSLLRRGVEETNPINLIVDKAKFLNKKIIIRCKINWASVTGASCYDEKDKQAIKIDTKGIDKEFFKYILSSCTQLYSKDNNFTCSQFLLQGVVEDGKELKLINVSEI